MAFVRSWIQRSAGGRFGRVDLGAGDDLVHAASWLSHRCARASPNFLRWCCCLPRCPRHHGVYDDKMARACGRTVSFGHRRGVRHAGADRRRAPLFDYATTLDLLLDHLYGHERWLPDRCTHLRLCPAVVRRTWSFKSLWITNNYLPDAVFGKPRFRAAASSDDLF